MRLLRTGEGDGLAGHRGAVVDGQVGGGAGGLDVHVELRHVVIEVLICAVVGEHLVETCAEAIATIGSQKSPSFANDGRSADPRTLRMKARHSNLSIDGESALARLGVDASTLLSDRTEQSASRGQE